MKKSIEEHLSDIPVAIVNGYLDLPNVYGVLIDEERGVKDCAELMLKKGKKHLVMAVDSDTPSNRNKQKGYIRAMTEQGIAKKDILLYTAVNKEFTNPRDVRAAGAKLTEHILTERPETDGIIYTTDLLAIGGLEAAKKKWENVFRKSLRSWAWIILCTVRSLHQSLAVWITSWWKSARMLQGLSWMLLIKKKCPIK